MERCFQNVLLVNLPKMLLKFYDPIRKARSHMVYSILNQSFMSNLVQKLFHVTQDTYHVVSRNYLK